MTRGKVEDVQVIAYARPVAKSGAKSRKSRLCVERAQNTEMKYLLGGVVVAEDF